MKKELLFTSFYNFDTKSFMCDNINNVDEQKRVKEFKNYVDGYNWCHLQNLLKNNRRETNK